MTFDYSHMTREELEAEFFSISMELQRLKFMVNDTFKARREQLRREEELRQRQMEENQ